MNTGSRRRIHRREGAILFVALVAMVIMTAIAAAAASATLRNRQSRKTERDRIQLNLLCDAGLRITKVKRGSILRRQSARIIGKSRSPWNP